jgi:hypothetical protein
MEVELPKDFFKEQDVCQQSEQHLIVSAGVDALSKLLKNS